MSQKNAHFKPNESLVWSVLHILLLSIIHHPPTPKLPMIKRVVYQATLQVLQQSISASRCHLLAKVAKEVAAATSLLVLHPGAGSSDSAAAIIPTLPMRLSCLAVGAYTIGTGSPTAFTFDEDDILMGMVNSCSRDMLDPAPAASGSTNHPRDFKTEFHPRSKHSTLHQSFEEFGQQNPEHIVALDSEPWHPFASEGDYIFAMIAVEAGLSSTQSSVTTNAIMQFLFKITVPYKGEDVMLQVHICPLWDWALDLLQNPSLALHFIWDAQWLFKHDGKKYECFYTKPWMGDHWWDIQVHIGWLLIVPELANEERKTGYVNFKHVIWHEAFAKLLKKVAELSNVGYLYECYDKTYEMCTTQQHKEALAIYEDKKSASEKKLKSLGLCPIKNVFWSVEHSEPEQATSFKLLHSLHGGMGGKHTHKELKIVVSELGCNSEMELEEQVSAFPCWHDVRHDQAANSPAGYWLLCMIRSYLQLDTLIGLDIQTETTIGMIENELIVFRDKLKAYHSCVHHLDDMGLKEDWNFPKAHLWKHPNEKMHGPLKDAYQDHSNGKDIAGQILHIDHHRVAVKFIQVCIDAENECNNVVTDDNGGNNEDDHEMFEGNTKLGAPQQPTSLSNVETSHKDDRAFNGFCWKLETFLNTCLPTYGYPLDKWIQLQGIHMLALVQPLTARIRVCRIDQDFDLIQVKAVSRAASMFIPMKSII
ncbi:hypothetical protein BKA83DRAFT_4127720 [Pisolithus microcarpus]|nr:hypothetical protein BKA83DRAFT_4127720 [Pisolithus microcarpus]